MPHGPIANAMQRFLRSTLEKRLRLVTDAELCEPTMVLAPHEDDETLGCGGTIARLRRLGASVTIVFMTNGSRSHDGLIDRAELVRQREAEAIAACGVLGVAKERVHFLGIENGELEQPAQREAATRALMKLLAADPPRRLLVPYHREPPPDHFVTTEIAWSAIRELELDVSVWEYPIWFLHFWPFSWDPARSLREVARRSKQTLVRVPAMLRELRTGVAIDHVLDVKREALRQHATQTQRRHGNPAWPILDDVDHGAFTAQFFQNVEVFAERTSAHLAADQARTLHVAKASGAEIVT